MFYQEKSGTPVNSETFPFMSQQYFHAKSELKPSYLGLKFMPRIVVITSAIVRTDWQDKWMDGEGVSESLTLETYGPEKGETFRLATRGSPTRVARFFQVQTYQNGKIYQNGHKLFPIATKCTKWQKNIPEGHKI
jgi:hypothetical protein